jgi:hypothetical protein
MRTGPGAVEWKCRLVHAKDRDALQEETKSVDTRASSKAGRKDGAG